MDLWIGRGAAHHIAITICHVYTHHMANLEFVSKTDWWAENTTVQLIRYGREGRGWRGGAGALAAARGVDSCSDAPNGGRDGTVNRINAGGEEQSQRVAHGVVVDDARPGAIVFNRKIGPSYEERKQIVRDFLGIQEASPYEREMKCSEDGWFSFEGVKSVRTREPQFFG